MTNEPETLEITHYLTPGRQEVVRGDLVATARVVSSGKIRIELKLDGELAKHLRSQSCAANRAKLRGRQRPRSD